MKSFVLFAAASTALLGACASAPTTQATGPADGNRTTAYGPDVDGRTVDAINRVARTQGLEVHWINYPQARPSANNSLPVPDSTGT